MQLGLYLPSTLKRCPPVIPSTEQHERIHTAQLMTRLGSVVYLAGAPQEPPPLLCKLESLPETEVTVTEVMRRAVNILQAMDLFLQENRPEECLVGG